jgi:hypothetical protein
MPEDAQAATPPVVFPIASANFHGGTLAGVQPAFELAQDLLGATGQRNQLLILTRPRMRFHQWLSTRAPTFRMFGRRAIQPGARRV